MYPTTSSDPYENILLLVMLVLVFGSGAYGAYRRKHRTITMASTPVLLTYYTEGALLLPVQEGKFGDMYFSAIMIANLLNAAEGGNRSAGLLYRVELPFQTKVHLLGIPKHSGIDQIDPAASSSLMEPVQLEGTYSQHIALYCEKGMQTDARYVLDPAAMVFTIDFCQSHSWEIVGNELYFVQTGGQAKADPTFMSDDIVRFVQEIKPSVSKPLSKDQLRRMTPYGKDRRDDLKCPLCTDTLINKQGYFVCPKGDGVLLTGSALVKAKRGKLELPATDRKPPKRDEILTCPSCGSSMLHVAYNSGPVMIDSCTKCPYRWLDAGEYAAMPNLM